jgi:adenosylcobinamide-phosphate synthase
MDELAHILTTLPVPLDVLVLLLALLLDLTLGEPPNRLHPTVWIGKTVAWAERIAPGPDASHLMQLAAGVAMALLVPATWGAAAWAVAYALMQFHPLAYLVAVAMLLKTTFSVRMLHRVAAGIGRILTAGDIAEARRQMSALVSRDTSQLTVGQIAAGAIESVAENITDSIVGPLLAFALFGLPGAVAYRAINTLDSMVGYHGRYEYLGKASARLDDLVNLVPARLAALLLWLSTVALSGMAGRRAWRIMFAHRGRTESPNAGWTMAAMAGGLGVTLEKAGHYRLGDPAPEPEAQHIGRATRALYATTALAAAAAIGILWLRWAYGP